MVIVAKAVTIAKIRKDLIFGSGVALVHRTRECLAYGVCPFALAFGVRLLNSSIDGAGAGHPQVMSRSGGDFLQSILDFS